MKSFESLKPTASDEFLGVKPLKTYCRLLAKEHIYIYTYITQIALHTAICVAGTPIVKECFHEFQSSSENLVSAMRSSSHNFQRPVRRWDKSPKCLATSWKFMTSMLMNKIIKKQNTKQQLRYCCKPNNFMGRSSYCWWHFNLTITSWGS